MINGAFLLTPLFVIRYGLLAALLVFQLSAHWIIAAEERWCRQAFGEEYVAYARRVRRCI